MNNSYSAPAKFFHWAIALIVLALLGVGFFMAGMSFSPLKLEIYGLHKSFGILVLVLAVLRLGWRFISPPPPELESHQPWEKALSKLIHVLLYGAIFLMPLSGWVMSSAGDFTNQFFGLFEMPDLVSKDEALFKLTRELHEILAFVIIGCVGLHLAGALKHHFIDRDETLQRMTRTQLGFGGGALIAALFGGLLLGAVYLTAAPYLSHDKKIEQLEDRVQDAQPGNGEITALESDLPALSDGISWAIVPGGSSLAFTATQYGQAFEGRFEKFDGTIFFDPDNLEQNSVRIDIDISSIKTGSADRDAQALSPVWFAADEFPVAVFEATRFENTGANQYQAYGDLSIRGVKTPLVLPFSLEITESDTGGLALMRSEITLDRLDFGVGQGEWESAETIGNLVKMRIEVQAQRQE